MLAASQQLRSTIVLGYDFQRHWDVLVGLNSSGKSKVADLEKAVAIDEQVSRFQVPVNDASRVEVLQT